MPRPSNTEQRRTQIAGGLLQVMAKSGYDGASVGDIAKAARLAPGIVHYHFKDKREILLVALQFLVTRHDQRLADYLASAGADPSRRIAAFIDFHLGVGATADPETLACWVMVGGEALREPKVRIEYEKAIVSFARTLTSLVQEGIAQGVFRCKRADAAASALIATIQGYFVLAAGARNVIPRGSAASATKEMAEGLLHPTSAIVEQRPRRRAKQDRRPPEGGRHV